MGAKLAPVDVSSAPRLQLTFFCDRLFARTTSQRSIFHGTEVMEDIGALLIIIASAGAKRGWKKRSHTLRNVIAFAEQKKLLADSQLVAAWPQRRDEQLALSWIRKKSPR